MLNLGLLNAYNNWVINMQLNYLRLTKISTNLTLLTFFLFGLGLIFSIADQMLRWDILPDAIEKYAYLIIISFGIFVSFFIVSSVICSLTALAEFTAGKTQGQQPELTLSRRKKIISGITIVTVILAFFVFHKIDEYRKQEIFARDAEKFAERLKNESKQLEEALIKVLPAFPEDLLQKIGDRTTLENTDCFKELTNFLRAVSLSIPDNPEVKLLTYANEPYKYLVISMAEAEQYYENTDKYNWYKQSYLIFSKELENQAIENLFKENWQPLTEPLRGDFIDNTNPSSWGVLKLGGQVIAILLLKKPVDSYYFDQLREKRSFNHLGPAKIHSN